MVSGAYSVHRFRKALLQFVGGRLAQAAARAVLVLALVRVLPIRDYGAYMLIVGTAEMLLQVASFGILPFAQRYLPQMLTTLPVRKLHAFVAFLVVSQIMVLTVTVFVLGYFWQFLGSGLRPETGADYADASGGRAVPGGSGIPVFAEMLEAMLAQGQAARALMVFARAAALLLLILVKPRVGLRDVLLIDMFVTGLCVVLMWFGIRRNLASLHNPAADGCLPVREMARFAWHMALVGPMSATASPGAIRLVLASSLGLAESGLFAFLQSLERLVSRYLPATLLKNLIRPVLISRFVGQGSSDLLQGGHRAAAQEQHACSVRRPGRDRRVRGPARHGS